MSNNHLRYIILTGLFVIPFVPFVVASSLFFPFITGKAFVFRLIVEIIFATWLVLAIRDESYRPKFSWILGALVTFLVVMGVADFFGVNSFKAFWSNYERMEGYITLLHLGALFFVMGSMLKTQEVWNKLLATSLGASVIMAIYSFLQIAGKVTINQGGVRVDGTLGNASYLGIYMVFHIFFALLLFVRFNKDKWKKILLAVVALMNLVVLYFTATRGAILGLIGGILVTFIYLLFKSEKGDKIRKVALIGIVGLIIFIGLFIALKNTSFVQRSPVLSRFASLSFSELETQGRYFVLPLALKGFIEKPVLGWGQEGFNFVFNKYYDPRMYNQEPWFDRAHSTPLDWLIAGGALGLLAYASIFLALLFYIFRSKGENLSKNEKAIMLGLISAYVFNNLFVFDQISSYILFFTVIAYIHSHSPETNLSLWDKISIRIRKIFENDAMKPVIEASTLILTAAVIYFVIYLPWQQNKNLLAVLKLDSAGTLEAIEVYTKPLAGYGMGFSESLEHISQTAMGIAANSNASTELKQQVFNLIDKSFVKQLQVDPDDARYKLFYGIFLSRFGWYGRAVEQLTDAQKLSPKKQQIYFELVNNLLFDGKTDAALQDAKIAYELDLSYNQTKLLYGLVLLASGEKTLSDQILEGVLESDIIFNDGYLNILLALKKYDQIIAVAKRRIELDPENFQHSITLTAAYLQVGNRADAIQTLENMIKLEPSFKDQGEYYINQIKAGKNP